MTRRYEGPLCPATTRSKERQHRWNSSTADWRVFNLEFLNNYYCEQFLPPVQSSASYSLQARLATIFIAAGERVGLQFIGLGRVVLDSKIRILGTNRIHNFVAQTCNFYLNR
jgi:hypothetical protein